MSPESGQFEERDRRWQRWFQERERHWEEWTERRDRRWEELAEEHRRYNDALLERHARITADQIATLDEMNRRSEENFVALQSEIAEQRAEIREQTQALMRMLDRLPPREG